MPRLGWDWWWWLLILNHPERPEECRQLMVLWSTKETPLIDVSGREWIPEGKPNYDSEGGFSLSGMIAAWWFDGDRMWEPLTLRNRKMAVIPANHNLWPDEVIKSGAGALIPLDDDDLSMGMRSDASSFWLNLSSDKDMKNDGAPSKFSFDITPWNKPLSTAQRFYKNYANGIGYDILRLQGSKVKGEVDGEKHEGTAYFQKVRVQAPSIPWYWGMLHFDDGSYLDWFIPHLSFSVTSSNSRPWALRDIGKLAVSTSGVFHDVERKRTEKFNQVRLTNYPSNLREGGFGKWPEAPLPKFNIEMWNGRTRIRLEVQAISRAHWSFNQPTRGGMVSHLTYNEYPLKVQKICIDDEKGQRRKSNWNRISGNAEHSWGLLH